MDDFEKKVSIFDESEDMMDAENTLSNASKVVALLRQFLAVQQRRAQAYARLKSGFGDYIVLGGESAYQQLCSEITVEFNHCSKQVLELESSFLSPDFLREDLAHLLRSVQTQEKQKLQLVKLTAVLIFSPVDKLLYLYYLARLIPHSGKVL